MQIQVLNLLHVILQKTKDNIKHTSEDEKKMITELITSNLFFPVLIEGL